MPAEPVLTVLEFPGAESPVAAEFAIREMTVPGHWPPPQQDETGSLVGTGSTCGPLVSGQALQPLPRQFAVLLAEGLAGMRPVRQLMPWMSSRGAAQLRRLLPLFAGGYQPRVLRVFTASPAPDVIEMTVVVATGSRTRALAVRLERANRHEHSGAESREASAARAKLAPRWLCTDVEAA